MYVSVGEFVSLQFKLTLVQITGKFTWNFWTKTKSEGFSWTKLELFNCSPQSGDWAEYEIASHKAFHFFQEYVSQLFYCCLLYTSIFNYSEMRVKLFKYINYNAV